MIIKVLPLLLLAPAVVLGRIHGPEGLAFGRNLGDDDNSDENCPFEVLEPFERAEDYTLGQLNALFWAAEGSVTYDGTGLAISPLSQGAFCPDNPVDVTDLQNEWQRDGSVLLLGAASCNICGGESPNCLTQKFGIRRKLTTDLRFVYIPLINAFATNHPYDPACEGYNPTVCDTGYNTWAHDGAGLTRLCEPNNCCEYPDPLTEPDFNAYKACIESQECEAEVALAGEALGGFVVNGGIVGHLKVNGQYIVGEEGNDALMPALGTGNVPPPETGDFLSINLVPSQQSPAPYDYDIPNLRYAGWHWGYALRIQPDCCYDIEFKTTMVNFGQFTFGSQYFINCSADQITNDYCEDSDSEDSDSEDSDSEDSDS